MLLAADVGNTQTVLGLFSGEDLVARWRVATRPQRTADDLIVLLDGLFARDSHAREGVEALAISSTVPALAPEWAAVAERHLGCEALVVGPGVRSGIQLLVDNPREVGPDRIVNSLAAHHLYGGPAVVVDFGTSTNFDCVNADGAFVGGVIAPGVEVSMEALTARAARLGKIELIAPETAIGRTTVHCMQSGAVFGFAGQVQGILDRVLAELGEDAATVSTGGLAPLIAPLVPRLVHHAPDLTLVGLRLVFERNR